MENKEEIRFSLNLASVFSSRCLTRFTCAYHVSEFKASIPFHWDFDRTLNFLLLLLPDSVQRITKEMRQEDRSTDASIQELTYIL